MFETVEPEPDHDTAVLAAVAAGPDAEARTPARPAAPWSAFTGDEAHLDWVVYTPPPVVAQLDQDVTQPPIWEPPVDLPAAEPVATQSRWEQPAGFVPLQQPATRSGTVKYVAVAAVVAVVAALGWFGYQAFATTTPAPAPTPAAAIPAATVSYTSPDGHFTVGFPVQPTTSTFRLTAGGHTYVESMAAVPSSREAVLGIAVAPSIPSAHMAEFMRGAVDGFARSGRVSDLVSTTYDGHPAVTGTNTTADNQSLRLMFFAYSGTRIYMLAAPDDAALSALEAHFQPTS